MGNSIVVEFGIVDHTEKPVRVFWVEAVPPAGCTFPEMLGFVRHLAADLQPILNRRWGCTPDYRLCFSSVHYGFECHGTFIFGFYLHEASEPLEEILESPLWIIASERVSMLVFQGAEDGQRVVGSGLAVPRLKRRAQDDVLAWCGDRYLPNSAEWLKVISSKTDVIPDVPRNVIILPWVYGTIKEIGKERITQKQVEKKFRALKRQLD